MKMNIKENHNIWKIKHMCWLSQEAVTAEENDDLELAELIKKKINKINKEVLNFNKGEENLNGDTK